MSVGVGGTHNEDPPRDWGVHGKNHQWFDLS